ncbi:Nif3-like dinuclear metal center hexameric protein [Leuconostoc rapi]|uniref:Nif3-like dinuclear metal center hexameric protein n=1 Tax=Leuconostoc rapi TaxID=1406906 RepID=UPI0019581B96|nr:Nif3-like dinuclear metal center hexameric protein [Leuconostoc rapi]MBM7435033.1 dinuclear metal center YbgI/SA1388 family protein [Leuconostoc rapi]
MTIAQDLIDEIERFAPKALAEEDDPTGLQIGDPSQTISRVMTTLDVRPEVVQEAIEQQVNFIWAHHEAMFFPAKNLDLSVPQNKMYADLIKHNIVVYASHTNLDSTQGGMNDWLADALGMVDVLPLLPNKDGVTGLGRIGSLNQPITVAAYAEKIRDIFQVKTVRVIANDLQKTVQKVAVLGGDGGRWWRTAQAAGADVYITADVYYHVGHDILASDFVVIDPDHHMEAIANELMAAKVKTWFGESLLAFATSINTDPYTYL